jgi:hypothetical protein
VLGDLQFQKVRRQAVLPKALPHRFRQAPGANLRIEDVDSQPRSVVDVELPVRAGGFELQLPDLQLSQSERRLDPPHRQPRGQAAWRCPDWLLGLGAALSYINAFLLGAGANVWGKGTLVSGFVSAAIIIPIFAFRHFVIDKGKFPAHMYEDLLLSGQTALGPTRAGWCPTSPCWEG